jgi:hypothetical protein
MKWKYIDHLRAVKMSVCSDQYKRLVYVSISFLIGLWLFCLVWLSFWFRPPQSLYFVRSWLRNSSSSFAVVGQTRSLVHGQVRSIKHNCEHDNSDPALNFGRSSEPYHDPNYLESWNWDWVTSVEYKASQVISRPVVSLSVSRRSRIPIWLFASDAATSKLR